MIGSFVFTREEVQLCFRLVAQGALRPQVAATFPLEKVKEATDLMESREFFGKIVLLPGGGSLKRLGVDVGGTFTDLIYVDDVAGTVLVHKLPTTPADRPGDDRRDPGLTETAGTDPGALDQVFHGTTIATNIVIERGATVGMITTEVTATSSHIARHKKPFNFSNYQDLPWQRYPAGPAASPADRPGADDEGGTALVPLDEERAREQVLRLGKPGSTPSRSASSSPS